MRASSAPQITAARGGRKSKLDGPEGPVRKIARGLVYTRQEDHRHFDRDSEKRRRLLKNPTERSERSVRAASAVPIWQATIPAKVMVVARMYVSCRGEPLETSAPGLQDESSRT